MTYTNEFETQVEKFLEGIKKFGWTFNQINNSLLNTIDQSEFAIFFVNKSNIKLLLFAKFVEKVFKNKKKALFIHHIDELNEFDFHEQSVIDFLKINDNFWKIFYYEIQRRFQVTKDSTYNSNIRLSIISKEKGHIFPAQLKEENNLVFFSSFYNSSNLKICDMKTGQTIIELNKNIDIIYSMKFSQEYLQVDRRFDRRDKLSLFDKNGNLLKNNYSKTIKSIACNERTFTIYVLNCTYIEYFVDLYDKNLVQISTHSLKCTQTQNRPNSIQAINNLIFIWKKNFELIDVYTCKMNYKTTLVVSNGAYFIHSHPKYTNYIIVVSKESFEIINTNNFKSIGLFEFNGNCKMLIKDNFILDVDKTNVIAKMELINPEAYLHSKYTCKLEPFRPHLLKNPYLLPCGNSACFECIYECFYFDKLILKCNFQSCKNNHSFRNQFEKNTEIENEIKNNLNFVARKMLDYGNDVMSLGKKKKIIICFPFIIK